MANKFSNFLNRLTKYGWTRTDGQWDSFDTAREKYILKYGDDRMHNFTDELDSNGNYKMGSLFGFKSPEDNKGLSGIYDELMNGKTNETNIQMNADTNATNEAIAHETNEYNLQQTQETNALNRDIAEQNMAFQQAQLDYEKGLQQTIFDREDSSYQRTVNDMRNAGLNPLSMTGTNGAGETISNTVPQNGFLSQADRRQAYKLDKAMVQYSGLMTCLDMVSNLVEGGSRISSNIENTNGERIYNKYLDDFLHTRNDSAMFEYNFNQADKRHRDYIYRNLGISPHLPDWLNQSFLMNGINATMEPKDGMYNSWESNIDSNASDKLRKYLEGQKALGLTSQIMGLGLDAIDSLVGVIPGIGQLKKLFGTK